MARVRKQNKQQEEKVQQRRLRKCHLRMKRKNQDGYFYEKSQWEKKVFQRGQMVWGGLKKMLQTKKSLGQPGNHGWHGKSCVCVQGELISSDRELRMNERWERSILEYKTLF